MTELKWDQRDDARRRMEEILVTTDIPYQTFQLTRVTVCVTMFGRENAEKLNDFMRAAGFDTKAYISFDQKWTVGGMLEKRKPASPVGPP